MTMFNNSNNGGVNVNTRLYTSYSDTAQVVVGAWNAQLSIKFHPFKGVNAEGVRQYAQDRMEIISTSLTVDNTGALLKGIKEKIIPALNDGKEMKVSVSMGSGENRKVLSVLTDGKDVSLEIAIRVSEEGVAEEQNILAHKFNKRSYMVNYDEKTGKGEEIEVNADFDNFVKKLEDVYKLSPAVAHSINYNNATKASYKSGVAINQVQPSYNAPQINSSSELDFLPLN